MKSLNEKSKKVTPVKQKGRDNIFFSSKQELLSNPLIGRFVESLSELICGKEIEHSYSSWSCSSLPEAKINYVWHGTYKDNKRQLDSLSKGLQDALSNNNEAEAFYWCIKILDWGNVYRGCVSYLLEKYEQGILCCTIKSAVQILEGDSYDLTRFDQKDLRMDSGMTKIYALASERSIIYDSRVTAALFMLAAQIFNHDDLRQLEGSFIFAGGKSSSNKEPAKRKKTSVVTARIVLEPLKGKGEFPLQAHLNLVANWMLNEGLSIAKTKHEISLPELWQEESCEALLRPIEAALFMIGADISSG